ncbi:hypothetical protein BDR04DRAFT_1146168 [Suillus decipiens]|nr:hypothetical protein BDR04DRAFT_1146168 [Suillus decipiens]
MANNCQTTVTESSTFLAQYGEQYYMTIAAIGHSFMSFLIKAQCILANYLPTRNDTTSVMLDAEALKASWRQHAIGHSYSKKANERACYDPPTTTSFVTACAIASVGNHSLDLSKYKRDEDWKRPQWNEMGVNPVMLSTKHRRREYLQKGDKHIRRTLHPESSTYTLDLPNSPNIFPTFHASQLRLYHANDSTIFPSCKFPRPGPVVTKDGQMEKFIDRIIDEKKVGREKCYLVR